MAQKIINVGTVANDGTGDTIRGAFSNVNANFTELYSNIAIALPAFSTANAGFDKANAANLFAYNTGIGANGWANTVGTAGNNYTNYVGVSSNGYANMVGYVIGGSSNNWANTIVVALSTAGNNYASVLSSNNAVGANAWANTISVAVGTAGNNWTRSTFTTLSNTSTIYNTANASFDKANTAFQNTSGTFSGNLNISGTATSLGGFSDAIGPVREKFANTTTSNVTVQIARSVIIANNSGQIYINVDNDNNFAVKANIGSTIEIFQYGSGPTSIRPISPVAIYSSNNWANVAGQYLSVTLVKVLANTWMLTGNLKP